MFITSFQTVHQNVLKMFTFPELKTAWKLSQFYVKKMRHIPRKYVCPQAKGLDIVTGLQLWSVDPSEILLTFVSWLALQRAPPPCSITCLQGNPFKTRFSSWMSHSATCQLCPHPQKQNKTNQKLWRLLTLHISCETLFTWVEYCSGYNNRI